MNTKRAVTTNIDDDPDFAGGSDLFHQNLGGGISEVAGTMDVNGARVPHTSGPGAFYAGFSKSRRAVAATTRRLSVLGNRISTMERLLREAEHGDSSTQDAALDALLNLVDKVHKESTDENQD
jgi:hypothetical protein